LFLTLSPSLFLTQTSRGWPIPIGKRAGDKAGLPPKIGSAPKESYWQLKPLAKPHPSKQTGQRQQQRQGETVL
jgi:hypothetical protein